MKKLPIVTVAATLILAIVACSKGEDSASGLSANLDGQQAANELLAHVPADSPYLFASLEPVPDDIIDNYLERLQPAIDETQAQVSKALVEMEAGTTAEGGDDPHTRLTVALLSELDGKFSREGFESLGLDPWSQQALYGMGIFPVYRLGLADPAVLRETIQRVLGKAGIPAPELEHQGVSYWRLSDDANDEIPFGLYISILEDHLAISLFPPAAEATLLPAFLGLSMPADSNAQELLSQLNRNQAYTPYGSGYVEFHKLADQFLKTDSQFAQVMAGQGDYDPSSMSTECITEIHGIIDNTPRMTMGITELNKSAIGYQYRVEMPETLAGQLLGLVSNIPAANTLSKRVLEFSFGMRFGPVRDFLREKATAIAEAPYQCEHLADLNSNAVEALDQLNQPMPPFLNNFRGVRASISEIMMNSDSIPENARGYLAVHVEKPEMFVGMAQMFLPDLSELAITPGDPPVRLPESLIPVPGIVAWAAMSSDAIALSLGEGEEAGLAEFLDQESAAEGTFLSADYDMATYLDYTDKLGDNLLEQHDHDAADEWGPDHPMVRISEAGQDAVKEMMGRSSTSLRFSPEGLLIDGRMTFK